MQNQMLSIVDDPAKQAELRSLFAQYPFQEMSKQFARAENCAGITFEDASIYILPCGDAAELLMIYLHECAHCMLLRQGVTGWHLHNDYFARQCRELQARFDVSHICTHYYDQQDAMVKTTAAHSSRAAKAVALATEYDPTQRAAYHAAQAIGAERRSMWRYALVVGGAAIAFMAGMTLPWAEWWDAIMLDGDNIKLVAGAVVAGWLWWNFRR